MSLLLHNSVVVHPLPSITLYESQSFVLEIFSFISQKTHTLKAVKLEDLEAL